MQQYVYYMCLYIYVYSGMSVDWARMHLVCCFLYLEHLYLFAVCALM